MSAPKESQQNKDSELEDILRLVRDAGAIDDNMGAEDWRASDLAIDKAKAALTVLLNAAFAKGVYWGQIDDEPGLVEKPDNPIDRNEAVAQIKARLQTVEVDGYKRGLRWCLKRPHGGQAGINEIEDQLANLTSQKGEQP